MLQVREDSSVIVIHSRMRAGERALFLLASFVPLLAPYELLIRPAWQSYVSVPFVLAAIISAGAASIAVLLASAAVAGLDRRMTFDRDRRRFSFSSGTPLGRWRTSQCSIDHIEELTKEPSDWTEGPQSFFLVVRTDDGRSFRSGSSWSEEEIDTIVHRVSRFLGRSSGL